MYQGNSKSRGNFSRPVRTGSFSHSYNRAVSDNSLTTGSPNNSQNSTRPSSGGGYSSGTRRPSFGGNKSYGGGRFNGGGRRFGQNSNSRRPKGLRSDDLNLFINKAKEAEVIAEVVSNRTFDDFNISTPLKENIKSHGYVNPTPIQDQAMDSIIEGKDLIGLANTGTGKTAAFLIPIIDKIFKTRDQKALIIAPTRELAVQINDELRAFATGMRVYSCLLIGGANMFRQIHEIRRNPHVLIATPGRLKDLIERNIVSLSDFSTIVLDEVDLMVDIGFIQDVKYFISLLPEKRQSLFFSATISAKINEVLKSFVKDPVTVSVRKNSTADNIEQDVVKVVDKTKKLDQLHDLLIKDGFDKVLIFGRTKHSVEKLHKDLEYRGFKTGAIHGNKTQGHRQRVLRSFKQNEIQILLATDVASRGLDIDNVTHVINYELPESYEDYVHRIGRTGRAGKSGTALTFID